MHTGRTTLLAKKALQKIQQDGVRRKFVGLKFLDDVLPPGAYWRGQHLRMFGQASEDSKDGTEADVGQIGVVTAYSDSPKFGCNLGLGYMDADIAKPGTLVGVQTASGNVVAATVSKLPFKISSSAGGRKKKE